MNFCYSDFLKSRIAPWGVTFQDDQPITDADAPDPVVFETLDWPGVPSCPACRLTVRLFSYNGSIGFCLDYRGKSGGFGWGPCLKFSEPYPTRPAALRAAVVYLKERDDVIPAALAWLVDLSKPKQLKLI